MNDFERDELDAQIEEIMQDCVQKMKALQRKINTTQLRALDEGPHLLEVCILDCFQ